MAKLLENLGVVTVAGQSILVCEKCGQELGSASGDYKDNARKRGAPLSKNQPRFLAPKTDKYTLREYYCSK